MKEIPFSSFYQAYQKEIYTFLMYASRRNMMPFTLDGVRLSSLSELANC